MMYFACRPKRTGRLVRSGSLLRTLEQGQARRAKGTSAPRGDLGDPDTPAASRVRPGLALFNLAVDSKLRTCDLVQLRVKDVTRGDRVAAPAIVMHQRTWRPRALR